MLRAGAAVVAALCVAGCGGDERRVASVPHNTYPQRDLGEGKHRHLADLRRDLHPEWVRCGDIRKDILIATATAAELGSSVEDEAILLARLLQLCVRADDPNVLAADAATKLAALCRRDGQPRRCDAAESADPVAALRRAGTPVRSAP